MDDVADRRLDNVALGLERMFAAAVAAGFQAASEERRTLHAEAMRKFQTVIDEARNERRIEELEARIAKLEAALYGGGRQ